MERISLTRSEKEVLRLLGGGLGCPDGYPRHVFCACAASLERKGLARCAWAAGHKLVDARITPYGKEYLALNPRLRNPIDWKWVVTTAIALAAVVAGFLALFISCSMLESKPS